MIEPCRELYRDRHRGINVEVSRHWDSDRKSIWCFYLYLLMEQFPDNTHKDLMTEIQTLESGTMMQLYPDSLMDLRWHSGMTFYEIEKPRATPFHTIKAGCDYNHLWDEGLYYNAEEVMGDAKRCVDSLFTAFPTLKTPEDLWNEYRVKFKEIAAQKT